MQQPADVIYDKFARFYDRFFDPLDRIGLARWRAEAVSLLPKDARILELGAGTGRNFPFYGPDRRTTAIEISFEMIQFARDRASGVGLVQADAQSLPFADRSFDAAIATLVFCSVPDPAMGFREIIRTVRPGGRVVLLEHVRPSGITGHFFDALSKITVAAFEDHFNRRTALTASTAGLKILEVRKRLFGAVELIVAEVPK